MSADVSILKVRYGQVFEFFRRRNRNAFCVGIRVPSHFLVAFLSLNPALLAQQTYLHGGARTTWTPLNRRSVDLTLGSTHATVLLGSLLDHSWVANPLV